MPLHYPDYLEAMRNVRDMTTENDLLGVLDTLYGRDNLEYGASIEDLRAEALRQTEREFTDTSSEEYSRREFYIGLGKAMREGKY